jgi:hypothetical protein
MSFTPSIIPAGPVILRGYQENNIFRQAQGIEAYQQLINYNVLQANQGVTWELPIDFELMAIWVKTVTVPNSTAKVDLSIDSLIASNNFTTIISLNLQAKQIDSYNLWCGWSPPLTILPKGLTVKLQANVPTEIMYLGGKECYLNPAILPSILQ